MEKTHQVVWDSLLDNGRLEWKQTLTDLEKTMDVAYEDFLEEIDNAWCDKDLYVTCSNLYPAHTCWWWAAVNGVRPFTATSRCGRTSQGLGDF
jgi:hypothetical protein